MIAEELAVTALPAAASCGGTPGGPALRLSSRGREGGAAAAKQVFGEDWLMSPDPFWGAQGKQAVPMATTKLLGASDVCDKASASF